MSQVDEAVAARTPIGSDLAEGVKAISLNQEITFTRYEEHILPLDGYRFWVKKSPVETKAVTGSLHYASDTIMNDQEVYTQNRVVFTSLEDVEFFNEVAPDEMWIADFEGMKFAFNSRGSFYRQTELYHYVGTALYPDMATQVVDSAADLDPTRVIVSNSLPLWLELNGYTPINPGAGYANPVTLYPAQLSPSNLTPPYATVDIPAESPIALASAPHLASDGTHDQLCTDVVTITLWGLRNDQALQFLDCVLAYTTAISTFGIMNMPIIRDVKRQQSEMGTLAQKKVVQFEISYYQYTARASARKLILAAQATFYPPPS